MIETFSILYTRNKSDRSNFGIKKESSVEYLDIVKLPVDPEAKLNQQAILAIKGKY